MSEIIKMNTKQLLDYCQGLLDEESRHAKEEGRLECWTASEAPPEYSVAIMVTQYPQVMATLIAAA